MFNIKLEEKSYEMSFKALPFKIQPPKNRQGGTMCPHPTGADKVKFFVVAFEGKIVTNGVIFTTFSVCVCLHVRVCSLNTLY